MNKELDAIIEARGQIPQAERPIHLGSEDPPRRGEPVKRNPYRIAGNVLTVALVAVALVTALIVMPIAWLTDYPDQWLAAFIGWYVFGGAAIAFYVARWATRRSYRWDREHG